MSTIKANTIQSLSGSDSIKIRTNAQDSLTVDSSGNITVRNEAVIDGINIGLGSGSISTNLRIGTNALSGSGDGTQNTALGHQTLDVNNGGSSNTAVGYGVLIANTTGNFNVGVGDNSQKNTNTGNNNTAVGYNSGNALGSDSGNTCIGSGAVAGSNVENSIALGYNASAATSNSLYLGTPSGLTMYVGNGSVMAPLFGARAWVNFNGNGTPNTNQTIRASGNVSSVYKNGTGLYTINFATPMPHANYCTIITTSEMVGGNHAPIHNFGSAYNGSPNQTTTSIPIKLSYDVQASYPAGDTHTICVVVFA